MRYRQAVWRLLLDVVLLAVSVGVCLYLVVLILKGEVINNPWVSLLLVLGFLVLFLTFFLARKPSHARLTPRKVRLAWEQQFERADFLLRYADQSHISQHQYEILSTLSLISPRVYWPWGCVEEAFDQLGKPDWFWETLARGLMYGDYFSRTNRGGVPVLTVGTKVTGAARRACPLKDFEIPDSWTRHDSEVANAS